MPIDDQLAIFGRIAFAAALGAVIGLQRELQGYPAGIRTIALVTLGATLFTEVSQLMGGDDRVAAQIVTGIGFIGAGVIFREQFTVRGITTAATIWAAAAIGMAVGLELFLVASVGTLLIFFVLWARPVTRRMDDLIRRWFGELREEFLHETDPKNDDTPQEERRDD
ncbi:MAG: MgtC/SapB family protein [Chloroflexi bacterium]|nr:MgtC/SapB family protein [Chloroflexota bacterium]